MINRKMRHEAQTDMEIEYKRLQKIIKTLRQRREHQPDKKAYYDEQLRKYLEKVVAITDEYNRANNLALQNRARAQAQVDGYREIVGRVPSDPPKE